MSKLKVGIIGANGFIGRHLTQQLSSEQNVEVQLYGRHEKSVYFPQLPYHQIDLLHFNESKEKFNGLDIVYYLASETIPASSWNNPLLEIERNLVPFIEFNGMISACGVSKVVFVSSAGTVYGESADRLTEQAGTNPFSPYGIVKLTMENFLNYFQKKEGLNFDIYRVSNVYGIGQDTSKGLGIINTFLEKIISEQKIVIYGDGKSVRNYVYVNDVAKMLAHSIHKPLTNSDLYNIASSDTLSINELVTIISAVVAEIFEIQFVETRKSDNPSIDIDNSKLTKELKAFSPTSLLEGISQTYSYLKQ